MTCCDKKAPIDHVYVPLNKRLVDFGKEVSGEDLMKEYSYTFMWIFTFYTEDDLCDDCQYKFSIMYQWFQKYGLFTDVTRNVKWIHEHEPDKNLIYREMGFTKTPMHLFCDSEGKIIDMIMGFPTPEWLDKYILPLVKEEMKF